MSLWLLGEGGGDVKVREFGMDMYTLLYLKWITNKNLLYRTGNPAQFYVWEGKGISGWEGNLGEKGYKKTYG